MHKYAVQRPVLDAVVGGWQVAGTLWYRSGNLLSCCAMLAPQSVQVLAGTGKNAYWFDATGRRLVYNVRHEFETSSAHGRRRRATSARRLCVQAPEGGLR